MNKIAALSKYGFMALNAISQVQAEYGASKGNATVQQSKLQMAVALILAGAHAGEVIPIQRVQTIATVVEMQLTLAKALGTLGKTRQASGDLVVLPADQQELPLHK